MSSAQFPADDFKLDGDPGSIRTSASKYSAFGTAATDAAGQIKSLDTSLFVGPEADTYRSGLQDDLPPHLVTTGQAFTIVGTALDTFSSDLSGYQERMRPLASKAPGLWQALQNAQTALSNAQSADTTHAQNQADAKAKLKDGETLPPDTYQSGTGSASSALSSAQQEWDNCHNAALTVKSDHQNAIDRCDHQIHIASGMRFHKNPSGWGALWSGFKNFVKDHVAELAKISSVLKTISAIAGVLSFVPGLDVIAAPIAIITGAAALAIDVSIKVATGQGSWKSIIIDGALMALPGVGKLAGKGVSALRGAKGAVTAVKDADGAITLAVKYKKGWSAAQRAAADTKVAQLQKLADEGKLIKSEPNRVITNLRKAYKERNGESSVTSTQDVDHIHELQLGGKDTLENTQALDRSVNRSVGSQLHHQIKGHDLGTKYGGVKIGPR